MVPVQAEPLAFLRCVLFVFLHEGRIEPRLLLHRHLRYVQADLVLVAVVAGRAEVAPRLRPRPRIGLAGAQRRRP